MHGLNFVKCDSSTPNRLINTTAGYSKNALENAVPRAAPASPVGSAASDCVLGNVWYLISLIICFMVSASSGLSGNNEKLKSGRKNYHLYYDRIINNIKLSKLYKKSK